MGFLRFNIEEHLIKIWSNIIIMKHNLIPIIIVLTTYTIHHDIKSGTPDGS